jgi:hypothetical protein
LALLDKVINKHHDKIEDIQAEAQKDIEDVINSIDIDTIIEDPSVLIEVVDLVKELLSIGL